MFFFYIDLYMKPNQFLMAFYFVIFTSFFFLRFAFPQFLQRRRCIYTSVHTCTIAKEEKNKRIKEHIGTLVRHGRSQHLMEFIQKAERRAYGNATDFCELKNFIQTHALQAKKKLHKYY